MSSALSYHGKPLLVPQWANDKSHQTSLLKPAKRQLRTQGEEVTHLVQVERTLTGNWDERCVEEEESQCDHKQTYIKKAKLQKRDPDVL